MIDSARRFSAATASTFIATSINPSPRPASANALNANGIDRVDTPATTPAAKRLSDPITVRRAPTRATAHGATADPISDPTATQNSATPTS